MSKRTGTLSDSVFRRSVEKNIKSAGYRGASAADETISAQASGTNAIPMAVNKVLAAGAPVSSISLTVLIPPDFDEKKLKVIIKKLSKEASDACVPVGSIDVRWVEGLKEEYITAYATGKIIDLSDKVRLSTGKKSQTNRESENKTGRESENKIGYGSAGGSEYGIVITKHIALGSTRFLIDRFKEDIFQRYGEAFINRAFKGNHELYLFKEYEVIKKLIDGSGGKDHEANEFGIKDHEANDCGVKMIIPAGEGGIYAALWELSLRMRKGFHIDTRLIPIRQETIEICEMYNVDPYVSDSTGSVIIVTAGADDLIKKLKENGINGVCAGYISDNNDKIIETCGRKRFLDKPAQDGIYSFAPES